MGMMKRKQGERATGKGINKIIMKMTKMVIRVRGEIGTRSLVRKEDFSIG